MPYQSCKIGRFCCSWSTEPGYYDLRSRNQYPTDRSIPKHCGSFFGHTKQKAGYIYEMNQAVSPKSVFPNIRI